MPPVLLAMIMTPESVGPMHGVQPRPKIAPSTGAPASPMRGTRWMRTSRWSPGMKPMNTSAMRDRHHAADALQQVRG